MVTDKTRCARGPAPEEGARRLERSGPPAGRGAVFSLQVLEGGPRRRQEHSKTHTVVCAYKGCPRWNSKTRRTDGKTDTKGRLRVRAGRPETDGRSAPQTHVCSL